MDKPKSKQQKAWVQAFLLANNQAEIISCYNATCGYYYYEFQWLEPIDLKKFSGYDSGLSYYVHQTYVELTPSAKTRNVKDLILRIEYPKCSVSFPKINTFGQLSLGEPIYSLPPPKSKPKIRFTSKKYKRRYFHKITGQLELPVLGLPALLHEIRTSRGESVKSSQELLAQKTPYYAAELKEIIFVPQALLDVLDSVKATDKENAIAIRMLETCGEIGALNYALSITEWRKINRDELI